MRSRSCRVFVAVALVALCSGAVKAKPRDAVVKFDETRCSGVCVNPMGVFFTVKHCGYPKSDRVMFADGSRVWVDRIYLSKRGDGPVMYVARGSRRWFPSLPLAKESPAVDDKVIGMGWSGGNLNNLLEMKGKVIPNTSPFPKGWGIVATNFQMTAGTSGGPLLNSKNEVVGLCSRGDNRDTLWIGLVEMRQAYDGAKYKRPIRARVVVFTTTNCFACEALKRDVLTDGRFDGFAFEFVEYNRAAKKWNRPALYKEFTATVGPLEGAAFPIVWMRGTTKYKVGYAPGGRDGLLQ